MKNDLTQGNIVKLMMRFSLPFLFSCFLQTFYGLADLFITGRFNGAEVITAVSVGSQVMHMLTVVIVGLATGSVVLISRCIGAGDMKGAKQAIGNTILVFTVFAAALTLILLILTRQILSALSVPEESLKQAGSYLLICFLGVPFITAYNVISSIFRGLGDTKSPMIFVAAAGLVNILLDYILIGPCGLGAAGAAFATVLSQAASVAFALIFLRHSGTDLRLSKQDLRYESSVTGKLLKVGVPIAIQEGFIQISFLVITVIANRRGVDVAAAVGIVEKIISFLFLVPSAMLSTVSAMAAQNAGAGLHERGKKVLFAGTAICVCIGCIFTVAAQFAAEDMVALFAKNEPEVIRLGGQYFRSYVSDCIFAGIHFCFSGYFSAYQRSWISFLHNAASILLVRIPGAYLASVYYPDNLFPMGLAAPAGSLLSALICVCFFLYIEKRQGGFR